MEWRRWRCLHHVSRRAWWIGTDDDPFQTIIRWNWFAFAGHTHIQIQGMFTCRRFRIWIARRTAHEANGMMMASSNCSFCRLFVKFSWFICCHRGRRRRRRRCICVQWKCVRMRNEIMICKWNKRWWWRRWWRSLLCWIEKKYGKKNEDKAKEIIFQIFRLNCVVGYGRDYASHPLFTQLQLTFAWICAASKWFVCRWRRVRRRR